MANGEMAETPRSRRRLWIVVAAGTVLLALVAGLLVLDSVLTSAARAEAKRLSAELSRPVEIGRVSTRILGGLAVQVSDLRIGAGPDEGVPLLELSRAEAKVALLPALLSSGKDLRVRSLEVDGVRLRVVRMADGTTNLGRLSKAMSARAPAPEAVAQQPAQAGLRLDRLALRDGSITLLDQRRPDAKELLVDRIEVSLQNLRAGEPLDLLVRAAVLAPRQNLELRLRTAPLPLSLVPAPDRLSMKLEPVDLGPLGPFLPDELELRAGKVQADLEAELGATVPGGKGPTKVRGGVQASGLRFARQEGGKPLDAVLEADLEGDAEKGEVRISKLRLEIGPAGIAGKGNVGGLAGGDLRVEGLEIVAHDLDPAVLGEYYPPLRRQLGSRVAGPIGLSLRASGTEAAPALQLRADLTPVRLSFPGLLSKAAGARATLVAQLRGGSAGQRFDAEADLVGVDLRPGRVLAKAPGERLAIRLEGARRTKGDAQTFDVSHLELLLPGDEVAGELTLDSGGPLGRRTTRIEFDLRSAHLDLDRLLLPSEGAKAREAKPRRVEKGRSDAAAGLSGRAGVRVGSLRMRQLDFQDVVLEVRLQDGEVTLERAHAGAIGGELSAAGSKGRLEGLDAPFQLLATVRGADLAQASAFFAKRKLLSGRLDADLDLKGGGKPGAELLDTLAGMATGKILGGVFHGKDVVSGVLGPVAQALPFARARRESKAEGTSLGKELPFSIRVADGVARLEKPLEVKQEEADITFEGGVTLRGEMDMPTTVALSPQTIASLTGGAAKPSAPIPVRFRLTGPFSSPTIAGLDPSPVVSAVLREAGGGMLGRALGAPVPPQAPSGQTGAPPGQVQPGQTQPEDPTKRLEEDARKRLRDLLGR